MHPAVVLVLSYTRRVAVTAVTPVIASRYWQVMTIIKYDYVLRNRHCLSCVDTEHEIYFVTVKHDCHKVSAV